jgi:hypothetical protein
MKYFNFTFGIIDGNDRIFQIQLVITLQFLKLEPDILCFMNVLVTNND